MNLTFQTIYKDIRRATMFWSVKVVVVALSRSSAFPMTTTYLFVFFPNDNSQVYLLRTYVQYIFFHLNRLRKETQNI